MRRLAFWLLIVAVSATACDVQVKDRFRSDSSIGSETTIDLDDPTDDDGEVVSTTVPSGTLRGVPVPVDILAEADELVSVFGRQVDMVATLRWSEEWDGPEYDLDFGTVVRLELTLLRVNELERLGILGEGDTPDPMIRWYSISGTVRHDLVDANCSPGEDSEDCEIAFVTDGAINGLASRRDDVVNLGLVWQTHGRDADPAVPSIAVRVRDSGGFETTDEVRVIERSLEAARFVGGRGTAVHVGRDAGRIVRSLSGAGRLEVVDVG